MSQTRDVLRGHEFDGIQEFDNRLPNWWLWTFYLACIFSFVYWIHYHILGTGDLPPARFAAEMAEHEARQAAIPVTDEILVQLSQDAQALAGGEQTFKTVCFSCHGHDGSGMLAGVAAAGPNLTDDHWLHGAAPTDIYRTITQGVAGKAMVAWQPVLGVNGCRQVAAYVLTLKGRNVPGGKAPEGDLVK